MERAFIRAAVFALTATALGGCALPGAVVVAGYAADGASYLLTGKSATDHALSAAVDRDCALLRVTMNEPVCRESEKNRREEREARDAAMTAYVAAADEVAPGQVVLTDPPAPSAMAGWLPPESGLAAADERITPPRAQP